jgi:Glycosyl hydrolase family 99
MRAPFLVGYVLAAALLTTPGQAGSPRVRLWTIAEARRELAKTPPFAIVDRTQADTPRFVLDVGSARSASIRPLGRALVVGNVKKWRDFRFAGEVGDLFTGTRARVSFLFSPGPFRGVRVRHFRGPPPSQYEPTFPVRAAFYYAWFPELWSAGGVTPYTHYHPSLGFYDSGRAEVLRRHVAAMRYAGLEAGIWSWWGIGDATDVRFPTALAVARPTPFRWAVYYEREGYGNPSVDEVRRDLEYIRDRYGSAPAYLRLGGRPVVFVYSSGDDCEVTDRWRQADPGGLFVVMKVFAGYADCPSQPDGWHQYGADFATGINRQAGYATTIMPGFWKADTPASPFPRDLEHWRTVIHEMLDSQDPFQLVVSFDEWGEGTAVESADEWASPSGYGAYLDALHDALVGQRQAASARRSSTVEPSNVSRRSKSPAQRDDRSGAAPKLAAVPRPSSARTRTASSR